MFLTGGQGVAGSNPVIPTNFASEYVDSAPSGFGSRLRGNTGVTKCTPLGLPPGGVFHLAEPNRRRRPPYRGRPDATRPVGARGAVCWPKRAKTRAWLGDLFRVELMVDNGPNRVVLLDDVANQWRAVRLNVDDDVREGMSHRGCCSHGLGN